MQRKQLLRDCFLGNSLNFFGAFYTKVGIDTAIPTTCAKTKFIFTWGGDSPSTMRARGNGKSTACFGGKFSDNCRPGPGVAQLKNALPSVLEISGSMLS